MAVRTFQVALFTGLAKKRRALTPLLGTPPATIGAITRTIKFVLSLTENGITGWIFRMYCV